MADDNVGGIGAAAGGMNNDTVVSSSDVTNTGAFGNSVGGMRGNGTTDTN